MEKENRFSKFNYKANKAAVLKHRKKVEEMTLNLGVFRLCIYDKASGKLFVKLIYYLYVINSIGASISFIVNYF